MVEATLTVEFAATETPKIVAPSSEEAIAPASVSATTEGAWPKTPLHKKKRGDEDDISIDAVVMPQDADEDVEQPNETVKKIEWPQQVIY
ncbi:uncharacterized protein A4U43_C08F29750 [Asparagus officinalis]|nr:uncharacterized protein A4U43_C08F29750 [Asparagus officinalis]